MTDFHFHSERSDEEIATPALPLAQSPVHPLGTETTP